MSHRFNIPQSFVHAVLVANLLFAGCDLTEEYENRRKASLVKVAGQSSVTKHIGAAVTVTDATGASTKVSFSPPKILDAQASTDKVYSVLSGVKMYDFIAAKGKGPMLYVCVQPLSVGTIDQVAQTIEAAVRLLSPELIISIGNEQLNAIDDSPQNFVFKRITVQGKHQFVIEDAAGQKPLDLPSTIDIFIVAGPHHYVAFVFRTADEALKAKELPVIMNASMRTVSIAP